MKDWLEHQAEIEKSVLTAVGSQVKGIVDDLLPQIRLAAIENNMESAVEVTIYFKFEGESTELESEGSVQFPPKKSASSVVKL
ncbi:MAG: hypothetical protein CL532_01675 [Aestuariivita sp.]|nr:hypothetical protein [Aestuariivita sp.]|tara:strand:+ start:5631 stop:5879 length:249 start_codon:yes stop_codon:yes gene_type:complete